MSMANKTPARRPASKQVRLKLVYIDFWSAVKLSFLGGLVLAIIGIVVAFVLWTVLTQSGIFKGIDGLFSTVSGQKSGVVESSLGLGTVMGFSVIVGILDLVVATVLGAVFAVLYNISVKITGGLLVGFTNN